MRPRSRLVRFMRLPRGRRRLLLEAAARLVLARVALRVIPFRWLKVYMSRRVRGAEVLGEERVRLRDEVVWAVETGSRHLPGRTVCFPRGITAQAMLRRRSMGVTLVLGAPRIKRGAAVPHVWVWDKAAGDKDLDRRCSQCYTAISFYPPETWQ